MKKIGILALVIGLFGLIATLGMDTTVETQGSSRVHNIGLINDQHNFLLVFIAVAVIGVVILVSSNRKTQSPTSSVNRDAIEVNQADRTCPFCAERIKTQAVVCRYCGHDVLPLVTTPAEDKSILSKSTKLMTLERTSVYLADVENSMRRAYLAIMKNSTIRLDLYLLEQIYTKINRHINKISALLATIGVVAFIYFSFIRDYSYFIQYDLQIPKFPWLEQSTSIVLASLIIYFRTILIKPSMSNIIDGVSVKQNEPDFNKSCLSFFGIRIDLVVLQMVMIALIFVLHNSNNLNSAYAFAVIASLLGYLLTRTGLGVQMPSERFTSCWFPSNYKIQRGQSKIKT
jgi:hypothetical protein